MLDSATDGPDGVPLLKLFNEWPRDWDAAFELAARGAFLITSSFHDGQVEFVKIESRAGGTCHLKNPWPNARVLVRRNGKSMEMLSGETLGLTTEKGETAILLPEGARAPPQKIP